ncbi:MAG TPA: lysophospholipid acyltransferase family protein [Myxococcota bacterium]
MLKDLVWIPINVLQALWLAAFTAFSFPMSVVPALLTGNREAAFAWGRVFWGPLNLKVGLSTLQIEGEEHLLPPGTPCVVMLNHQSMIDIVVAWMVVPTGPRFVAKKVLEWVPVVGWFMQLMQMVFVDRGNTKEAIAALRKAQAIVDDGNIVVCFPEGTRTKTGQMLPFKKGVFMMAIELGVPVLPVALEGAATLVPATHFKPRPARVRAKVGAPIDPRGLTRDELMQRVRTAIVQLNLEIGGRGGDVEIVHEQEPEHDHRPA